MCGYIKVIRGFDIHTFLTEHIANTHCLLEKLWISEQSLSVLEIFECRSDHLNIKYNSRLLFLGKQISYLFMLKDIIEFCVNDLTEFIEYRDKNPKEYLKFEPPLRQTGVILQCQ